MMNAAAPVRGDPDDYAGFGASQHDPRLRRWNLWAYIDGRDGAQAV
jgi:hypothetical protein